MYMRRVNNVLNAVEQGVIPWGAFSLGIKKFLLQIGKWQRVGTWRRVGGGGVFGCGFGGGGGGGCGSGCSSSSSSGGSSNSGNVRKMWLW